MAEYIEREAAIAVIYEQHVGGKEACENALPNTFGADLREIVADIEDIPAADVRPVVLCCMCELHGHCYTEDVFAFARLAEENRFCAVGKVKTNGEGRRKADVLQR